MKHLRRKTFLCFKNEGLLFEGRYVTVYLWFMQPQDIQKAFCTTRTVFCFFCVRSKIAKAHLRNRAKRVFRSFFSRPLNSSVAMLVFFNDELFKQKDVLQRSVSFSPFADDLVAIREIINEVVL